MTLRKFPQLADYIKHVQSKFPNGDVPFKIMGAQKVGKFYYSASLIAEAYNQIPRPDKVTLPIDTFFGEIYNYGCRLDSGRTYSKINPEADGKFAILQGDILALKGSVLDVECDFVMILSHSCGINYPRLAACPVFRESQLDKALVEKLKGNPVTSPSQIAKNWLWNENLNYLGLPMHPDESEKNGDRLLVCLSLPMHIDTTKALSIKPAYRLNYKSLSYLQLRIGLQYFRDVQNSDDSRDM